jgi:hypothetical protein
MSSHVLLRSPDIDSKLNFPFAQSQVSGDVTFKVLPDLDAPLHDENDNCNQEVCAFWLVNLGAV